MIEANKMIQKLGKEKFVETVLRSKDKEKTGAERQRGIKGRIKFRMCEHGTWVIDNYKPKKCKKCHSSEKEVHAVVMHTHEYFNIGTGTYGTTSEHRAYAKSKGLQEAG